MSRRPARSQVPRRDIDGIVLLDKPVGPTSNGALQELKRLYSARKAGHTGSLDPMASGLLPVCLGEATKVSSFLLDADKHYQLTACFGRRTTTGDAEGELLETRDTAALTDAALRRLVRDYRGDRMQTPPMYSAVKHRGQPLYKLARKGVEVEREARPIRVYALEQGERRGDEVDFTLHCSKGTYVRTLAEDMGDELGCGAHVTRLRRTGVGPYRAGEWPFVTLESLRELAQTKDTAELDALLQPVDSALRAGPPWSCRRTSSST